MSFRVDIIPNRNSPPAVLLRQSWREGKKIRHKTIANLSKLPPALVDRIRTVVKGGIALRSLDEAISLRRALPHGHVAAVLGICRQLGMDRLLHRQPGRQRDLALGALIARVLAPDSKLATARRLSPETADTSLGPLLGLGPVTGNEMLNMLDWLLPRQRWIEKSLARRHLSGGTLILYDVTSSYLEGRCCPLAAFGYNRDGKKGKKQIVFGLLCAADGCPVAVEVFAGNTGDPRTVGGQVEKIRSRFGIEHVALVGDRGMITTARIREDLRPNGLDWISALTTKGIRQLLRVAEGASSAPLQPGELVPDAVADIVSPAFPGERLLVCLNPRLREERARKREDLLCATEDLLEKIAASVRQSRLRSRDQINRRVGRDANRKRVEKHFNITVSDNHIAWATQPGEDRRRSPARRHLRHPHQPRHRYRQRCRSGRGLQKPGPGRACVPLHQVPPQCAPSLRLPPRPRPRPCIPLHARLLSPMAPAPAPCTTAVRGRRPPRSASHAPVPRRKSGSLRQRKGKEQYPENP